MDNRVFNVNGTGERLLGQVLELAFRQEWDSEKTSKCWVADPRYGFIIGSWSDKKMTDFATPMTAKTILPIVHKWLSSDEALAMQLDNWDSDMDHDGDNERGWRVYVETWGHIGDYHNVICAITPAFMWYGK